MARVWYIISFKVMREFREEIKLRPTVWQSRVQTNTPQRPDKEGEALPERIYNSHYGNGVPAMFIS